ncbi:MAG: lipase family protein [Bacteroidetes bacterium]|nr:lipase family protein [Bacteroidota bacterium]
MDISELREIMLLSARTGSDSSYYTGKNRLDEPIRFKRTYRSPVMGLANLWELWIDSESRQAAISIRGSVMEIDSWLANIYAAMIPAKGRIKSGKDKFIEYDLASDPKAAVHAGWLIAAVILMDDMQPRIDSCVQAGISDFIVTGHSQGGAIAYMTTALLYKMRASGKIPQTSRIKTYCSAAPKPGNLYFAYEYESNSQGGWAFNIVNPLDWVPEVPFSIQTVDDFNEVNPFSDAKALINKQKQPIRFLLKKIYRKLSKPAKRARKNYQKYLGKYLSKIVSKKLDGTRPEEFFPSNNYVRTGQMWLLQPDEEYLKNNPMAHIKGFPHHMHHSYIYLIKP